jgi:hypothetical protein
MKINELIYGFEIQKTNEEQALIRKLGVEVPYNSLTEREQVIFTNLERKDLVNRVNKDGTTLVKRNEHSHTPYKRTF